MEIRIMTAATARKLATATPATDESEAVTSLPDDAIQAILAAHPEVPLSELLRARARGRRLLALYRAGAIAAAEARTPRPKR
jgi:hypothetical protein